MNSKVGRNDPCPCGSGRKFKQCCLAGRPAGSFEDHVHRGNLLLDRGEAGEALLAFRRAAGLRPDLPELHLNIGLALQALGSQAEAISCYRDALARRPDHVGLLTNLAVALRNEARFDEAEPLFRRALAVDPASAFARDGLIDTLLAAGRLDEALAHSDESVRLRPELPLVHHRRGQVLQRLGMLEEALASFRRALEREPSSLDARSALLLAMHYSDQTTPADLAGESRRYGEALRGFPSPSHSNIRDPERRLRVGYVSGDFHEHSVAYFIEPVIEGHDRAAFEVHCYHTARRSDAVTARLRSRADRWCEAATLDDAKLAARIRADRIDILVDLSGHTAGHRLPVFARRPAPVQVSWIGYPGDTGLGQIPFRITDPVATPDPAAGEAGRAALPREWIRLEPVFCCYRPPVHAPEPRARQRGPDDTIVLGSCNNVAKITDASIRTWSRILERHARSRLLLKDAAFASEAGRAAILSRFAACGVPGERITLLGRTRSLADHLALYDGIDIALDTVPYCGVTTTCEALWMGVPVVSLAGDTFVSRMGRTLLSAAGHPEWCAGSVDGYVDRVLALARDPGGRERLRHTLRGELRASPLCDEAGHLRSLEQAMRTLWRRWCREVAV